MSTMRSHWQYYISHLQALLSAYSLIKETEDPHLALVKQSPLFQSLVSICQVLSHKLLFLLGLYDLVLNSVSPLFYLSISVSTCSLSHYYPPHSAFYNWSFAPDLISPSCCGHVDIMKILSSRYTNGVIYLLRISPVIWPWSSGGKMYTSEI